jgi:glutathione synthase/RimK-type ligase-like ATP-grasp enzyme
MQSIKPASLAIRVQCAGTVTEAALAQLEALLVEHSEDVELRFARAAMLEELNMLAAARGAYKGVLARDPQHFGALMNLGTLLYLNGRVPEARILYQHATKFHPGEASAAVNLANVLRETDPGAARATYEYALRIDPAHPTANYALSLLLDAMGEFADARVHRQRAFAEPILHVAPYHGSGEPVRILTLLGASGGNLVTTLILDDRYLQSTSLVADSYRAGMTLPPHDVLFNAIGDAERSDDALELAEQIVAASNAPVINDPAAVRATTRDAIGRFADIPNVAVPRTELIARDDITAAALGARGFTFPLLLRSPAHHGGDHFTLVASRDDLVAKRAALPGDELLAIEYMDMRDAHGLSRKYRAFLIDGNVYAAHMAVSGRWKVHYVTSDMRGETTHWNEERAFLSDMPAVMGASVMTALAAIAKRIGLDHCGIDFAIDTRGNVVIFEANATMGIYMPEDDERGAYRRPPIQNILAATERLVRSRAAAPRR